MPYHGCLPTVITPDYLKKKNMIACDTYLGAYGICQGCESN